MEEILLRELVAIIEACRQCGVPVYVIGAYSVRAYGYLLRHSLDLDLAVTSQDWPALAEVLRGRGFVIEQRPLWVRATRTVEGHLVALDIAIDRVTDLDTAYSYPLRVEEVVTVQSPDLPFPMPVFSLEGVFISKLLALRDNDVVDLLAILTRPGVRKLSPGELWLKAQQAGLEDAVSSRLEELETILVSGEAEAIWFDRMGSLLDDTDCRVALTRVRELIQLFENAAVNTEASER